MNNCNKCSKDVAAKDKLSCAKCREQFHYACTNILKMNYQKMKSQQLAQWLCAACKVNDLSSNRSRSSTPVSPSKAVQPTDITPNGSKMNSKPAATPLQEISLSQDHISNKILSAIEGLRDDFKKQRDDLTQIKIEIKDFKAQLGHMKDSVEDCRSRISSVEDRVQLHDNKLEKMDHYEHEMALVQSEINRLKSQYNKREQWDRLNNLEIINVPEVAEENNTDTIIKIAKLAGVNLTSADIEFSSRITPKSTVPGRPKTIVAKLRCRLNKDRILSGIRRKGIITTADLGMPCARVNLYVNEHLSPYYKNLFMKARELCKQHNWQFLWVRQGRIRARRMEKAPVLSISTEIDLKKIAGPA